MSSYAADFCQILDAWIGYPNGWEPFELGEWTETFDIAFAKAVSINWGSTWPLAMEAMATFLIYPLPANRATVLATIRSWLYWFEGGAFTWYYIWLWHPPRVAYIPISYLKRPNYDPSEPITFYVYIRSVELGTETDPDIIAFAGWHSVDADLVLITTAPPWTTITYRGPGLIGNWEDGYMVLRGYSVGSVNLSFTHYSVPFWRYPCSYNDIVLSGWLPTDKWQRACLRYDPYIPEYTFLGWGLVNGYAGHLSNHRFSSAYARLDPTFTESLVYHVNSYIGLNYGRKVPTTSALQQCEVDWVLRNLFNGVVETTIQTS